MIKKPTNIVRGFFFFVSSDYPRLLFPLTALSSAKAE